MLRASRLDLTALDEPLLPVLPKHLQQSIADAAVRGWLGDHQRPIDQAAQQIENVRVRDAVAARDGFGRLESPAAREGREPIEKQAVGRRQQTVAPVDRRAQCLLAGWRHALATAQQAVRFIEICRNLLH